MWTTSVSAISLFLLGLIKTALLAHGQSPRYAEAWLAVLAPGAAQRQALDFYTALFCLDFLGEIGLRFNRETAIAADRDYLARLQQILACCLPDRRKPTRQ